MLNIKSLIIMKKIIDFAAQQLTKGQMNSVKGGKSWICYVDGEYVGFVQADTKTLAEAAVRKHYGEGYCSEYRVTETAPDFHL